MNMKWFIINVSLMVSSVAFAQNETVTRRPGSDSLKTDEIRQESLIRERYLSRYQSNWNRLIPKYQKIQFAGSMGLISIGTGWSYCKEHLETDILFGFLPEYEDDHCKMTFTLKQNYIPWSIDIGDSRWNIEPLTCGLYMNSILDKRFWRTEPGRYPNNYYKFSTRIRFHAFIGQRFSFDCDGSKAIHKSVSFFYEFSSCDLYIMSAATNKTLRMKDYMSLSFGVKLQIL